MKKSLLRICLFLSLALITFSINAQNKPALTNKHKKTIYYPQRQLSYREVYNYIDSIGIVNPEIVLRQAVLETGHFKSKMLMDKNNLFAFRYTSSYMNFDSWKNSVDYYKSWQDKYYRNANENYYHFLKRKKYASSGTYISRLKLIRIKENLEDESAEK